MHPQFFELPPCLYVIIVKLSFFFTEYLILKKESTNNTSLNKTRYKNDVIGGLISIFFSSPKNVSNYYPEGIFSFNMGKC